MGAYIKGMDMPKDCGECQFCHTQNFVQWCCLTSRENVLFDARPEWCPLIEAPEPSIETTKKKAKLKENGNWECPDVGCDECDHHRTVEWCSLAIPNHEEIDDTYKMVNEAFFEGFDAAEKRYRFLIETVEELDKKLSALGEWIPCSERLPMMGDYVLTYRPIMGMHMIVDAYEGYYGEDDEEWYEGWIYGGDKVIAWMPLPKPYECGERSEE